MKNKNVLYLTQAAMIAALYVVLTLIANALGLASGSIQVRFSEALTVLPFFTPAAIPGLYIGCLLGNIAAGCALPDIVFGPLATLIGALGTWGLSKAASRALRFSPQRKAGEPVRLVVPAPAHHRKWDCDSACFEIRLWRRPHLAFRRHSHPRRSDFLRDFRFDSAVRSPQIQGEPVPHSGFSPRGGAEKLIASDK